VIDPRFIFLAALVSIIGASGYIRDTLRGETSPNRITWGLWGVEGILSFAVEIQQHVGLASITTLMLGLVPCLVVVVSFRNPHSVWKLGKFDVFCGLVSLTGLVLWAFINEPTAALISFVAADQIAALPTLRKSWIAPQTETSWVFLLGVINCTITLMTLRHFTTAGALFPGCILVTDLLLGLLIVTRIGQRFGSSTQPSSSMTAS
jgi:hypothetical protein